MSDHASQPPASDPSWSRRISLVVIVGLSSKITCGVFLYRMR